MIRTAVRGVGEVLITLGVVVILFAAYELYGTGVATAAAQHDLRNGLRKQWAAQGRVPVKTPTPTSTATPSPGAPTPTPSATPKGSASIDGIAILHIPRLGKGWEPRVVVEGVSPADLREGPGHYPDSAQPGQIGNFSIAGHRATHGNGFFYLNKLRDGDRIIVETRTQWFTYDVTGSERVTPDKVEVVAPVPDRPGVTPTKAMLTLTTCDPWWDSTHRLVIHAALAGTRKASQGPPPGADG